MLKLCIIFLLIAEFVSTQKCPVILEMAILVDSSGTIRPLQFFNLKKGLIELIKSLSTENQESYLGLIDFSNEPRLSQLFISNDDDKFIFERKIDLLAYFGRSTALEAAIVQSREEIFDKKKGNNFTPQILLILTDGVANEETAAIRTELDKLEQIGVKIFVVAIGDDSDVENLSAMASKPLSEFKIEFKDLSSLKQRINKLTLESCNVQAFN